jgi:hypothetical protein
MCIILVGCQQFFPQVISIIGLSIYVHLVIGLRERFACDCLVQKPIDCFGKIRSKND